MIQAVRIDGIFQELRVRSVKAQIPPYHPLVEVLSRDQMVFNLVNAQGTLVGFRFPACFSGINTPGMAFSFSLGKPAGRRSCAGPCHRAGAGDAGWRGKIRSGISATGSECRSLFGDTVLPAAA